MSFRAALGAIGAAIVAALKSLPRLVFKGGKWVLEAVPATLTAAVALPGALLNAVRGLRNGWDDSAIAEAAAEEQRQAKAAEDEAAKKMAEIETLMAQGRAARENLGPRQARTPTDAAKIAKRFANDILEGRRPDFPEVSALPETIQHWFRDIALAYDRDALAALAGAETWEIANHIRGEEKNPDFPRVPSEDEVSMWNEIINKRQSQRSERKPNIDPYEGSAPTFH